MNWIEFLDDNHIGYVTKSGNTKRGEVSIHCPFCGDDDPSEHLGISLTTENWGCLRNGAHRGKSPQKLIQGLLGCSFGQAKLVAGQYSRPDPSNLDEALASLTATSEPPKPDKWAPSAHPLELPEEFRTVKKDGPTKKFWNYLKRRGFTSISCLVEEYELQCALSGRWKDRVVIPFYDSNSDLVGWTGRAISNPVNAPRYLSSSEAVKHTVCFEEKLQKGDDTLFIVEGPFDALKLDYYGKQYGARATCVFGVTMSIDQICILSALRRRFKKVVVLFDQDAVEPAFYAADWLHSKNVIIGALPEGIKDPGELSEQQVLKLVDKYK
jgi:hypothetical protein